jgi:hypothetical protein
MLCRTILWLNICKYHSIDLKYHFWLVNVHFLKTKVIPDKTQNILLIFFETGLNMYPRLDLNLITLPQSPECGIRDMCHHTQFKIFFMQIMQCTISATAVSGCYFLFLIFIFLLFICVYNTFLKDRVCCRLFWILSLRGSYFAKCYLCGSCFVKAY